jgi:hypothetical protein
MLFRFAIHIMMRIMLWIVITRGCDALQHGGICASTNTTALPGVMNALPPLATVVAGVFYHFPGSGPTLALGRHIAPQEGKPNAR